MPKKHEKTNIVAEYLVKRIRELEHEIDDLTKRCNYLTMYKEEAEKLSQIRKLFKVEGTNGVYAIVMNDFNGRYDHIVAIDSNKDFQRYLDLLGLSLEESRKEEE